MAGFVYGIWEWEWGDAETISQNIAFLVLTKSFAKGGKPALCYTSLVELAPNELTCVVIPPSSPAIIVLIISRFYLPNCLFLVYGNLYVNNELSLIFVKSQMFHLHLLYHCILSTLFNHPENLRPYPSFLDLHCLVENFFTKLFSDSKLFNFHSAHLI